MKRYQEANEGIHAPEEVKEKAVRAAGGGRDRRWTGAVAAVLAVAVIGGIAVWPGRGGQPAARSGDGPGGEPMALSEDEPGFPVDEGPTGWTMDPPQTPGVQGLSHSFALAEAELALTGREFEGDLSGFLARTAEELLAGEDNLVYSPLNVYMALAMLAEGTDGESRQQILELLEAESVEALREDADSLWQAYYLEDVMGTSVMAGSLWLRDGISYHQDTLDTLAKTYHASTFSGEMGSEEYDEALRSWVNEQTHGVLSQQADGLSFAPDTVLELVSTLYFKAAWSSPFNPELNTQGIFHAPDGDVEVEYMNRGEAWYYYRGEHFGAVALGFQAWLYDMWLILPDEGYTVDDLIASGEAMEFITAQKYEGYDNETGEDIPGWPDREFRLIKLSVPKFDVSADLDLRTALEALGVSDVFDKEASDFTPLGADLDGPVYLSQARHAARVMIDEEGCTAASYVDLQVVGDAEPPEETVDFTLDRPFLFAITGNGDLPLFIGMVNQPNK